ncbi:unnamed protein product, partial [Closterium sp. NIES-64]
MSGQTSSPGGGGMGGGGMGGGGMGGGIGGGMGGGMGGDMGGGSMGGGSMGGGSMGGGSMSGGGMGGGGMGGGSMGGGGMGGGGMGGGGMGGGGMGGGGMGGGGMGGGGMGGGGMGGGGMGGGSMGGGGMGGGGMGGGGMGGENMGGGGMGGGGMGGGSGSSVQATLYSPLQQALSFAVPLAPTLASSTTPVALSGTCKMGPIGFALNGVPFYSTCDALGRDALQYEGSTFDSCGGHPTPSGQYHYHVAPGVAKPSAISASRSTNFKLCKCVPHSPITPFLRSSFWQDVRGQHSPLLGFLADGIPLFGPRAAGGALLAGLDECGGHVGDGSSGELAFYHYHASSTAPNTVACLKGCVASSDWGNLGSASCIQAT